MHHSQLLWWKPLVYCAQTLAKDKTSNHLEQAGHIHVPDVAAFLFLSFCILVIDTPQELHATPSHLSHLKLRTLPFSFVICLAFRAFGSSEHFRIAASRGI